jgi:hypothetical protein
MRLLAGLALWAIFALVVLNNTGLLRIAADWFFS